MMDWEALEVLVGDDPGKALEKSQAALAAEEDPDTRGRLLGFAGACYKALGDFRSAGCSFIQALRLARVPAIRGELYRRLGMLKLNEGALDWAERLCKQGIMLHVRTGDRESTGRGLVDLAVVKFHQGSTAVAIKDWLAALQFLEDSSPRYRFSCLVGLAAVAIDQGNREVAEESMKAAEGLRGQVGTHLQADYWFAKARIAAEQADYTSAIGLMDQSIESVGGRLHEKVHYCTFRVLYQLKAGQAEEAATTCGLIAALIVQADEQNDYISAIAMDLVRASTSTQEALSVELVERCLASIQSVRAHQPLSQDLPDHQPKYSTTR